MLRDHHELDLPTAQLSWTINEAESTVAIKAENVVARMVSLEITGQPVSFTDNFFTLLPNQTRTIGILSATSDINWTTFSATAINSSL